MSARLKLYGEAALVVVCAVAMVAAPIIVAVTVPRDATGLVLLGFLGFMAGNAVVVAPVALAAIRWDLRRAEQ